MPADLVNSAKLINLATRLLHYLVTTHESTVNMRDKLASIHGGGHKHLLCLARLGYSEDDLVLEAGIAPDVARCALELLELAVTPEEAEALYQAFSPTGGSSMELVQEE